MLFEILNEVNAVDLPLVVDHVEACKWDNKAFLAECFELINKVSQVRVVHVVCVPLGDLVEFKK